MERTMISFNVPNLLTINLMAWLGFLIFIVAFQAIGKRKARGGAPMTSGAGEIVTVGDY